MIQIPVAIDRRIPVHIQEQLDATLRQLIVRGELTPNTRLPATRLLSKQLKISRNTARNSYENLISEGYLCSKGTKGTYVASKLPDISIRIGSANPIPSDLEYRPAEPCPTIRIVGNAKEDLFDFRLGRPDSFAAPLRTWRRLVLRHLPYSARHVASDDLAGALRLREAISSFASSIRATKVRPERTFVVSGAHRALDILAHVLQRQQRIAVALEDPCDKGVNFIFERFGNRIFRTAVDDEGLIVEDLPTYGIAAVCVTPSHQYPMGTTMSLRRREALLSWAACSGAYVIECDLEGGFCYEGSPLPTLYSMDGGQRVIYVSSFASWLGSGPNLAYFVVPAHLQAGVSSSWHFLNCPLPWLDQVVAADFIANDSFYAHLRKIWQSNNRKRHTLMEAVARYFGPQNISGGHAGRHLVWHLPVEFPSADSLRRRGEQQGIYFSTLANDFCVSRSRYITDRVALLAYSTVTELSMDEGVSRLFQVSRAM